MWRVRRYDPKLLSESPAELGWKTIERIDYGPRQQQEDALPDAATEAVAPSRQWSVCLLLSPDVVLHQPLLANRMKLLVGDQLAERLTELVGQFVAPDANRR